MQQKEEMTAEKNKERIQMEELRKLAAQENESAKSTLRQFLLVTLIHAEIRFGVDKEIIINRIKGLFECRAIVIATEKHNDTIGKHYHVGIWAKDASKNTLRTKIRSTFKEWQGRAIDISLHKGWGSICKYIIKDDKEPEVWGEFNLDQIKAIAWAHQNHKEVNVEIGNTAILKKLEQIEHWYQVYRDEILANKILTNLPRMKEAFEDLKVLKDIETGVLERIIEYLAKKGKPKEYDVEELKEKYLVIDWIACQLCFKRPIKTKQLFIYGEPSTQKTLLLNLLAKVIRIYFASARKNDFAGANDFYDLWAFDEFHEHSEQNQYGQETVGSTMEGTAFVNNLLKVLDGQECRLDSKYAKVFKKKINVLIIMIANKLPQIMERHGPFRARFYRIRFSTQIQQLKEERVIATLYGCFVRRALKSPYYKRKDTPNEVNLAYNKSEALILTIIKINEGELPRNDVEQWRNALDKVENLITKKIKSQEVQYLKNNKAMLITRDGNIYQIRPKVIQIREEYKILALEILTIEGEGCLNWGEENNQIQLLDFANIPIKKRNPPEEKGKNLIQKIFQQQQEQDEENQEQQEEKIEQGKEEQETIKRIKNIFFDKKEREWIRRESAAQSCKVKVGQVKNEEVWSTISVQRSKKEHVNDYAMWPLEIKIYGEEKTENKNEDQQIRKVFPAFIHNVREGGEEEKIIRKEYNEVRASLEDTHLKIVTIKCEIALARNGEMQPWNLEC